MGLRQITYNTEDYNKMVQLRNQILRQPLGMTLHPEELKNEKNDIHIAAFDEDEILGCCVLTPVDESTLRLRQMAVNGDMQLKGIGASIITFAENIARDKGYKNIIMHARNTATGFYEKFGYRRTGNEFNEVNLPHYIMEKKLR